MATSCDVVPYESMSDLRLENQSSVFVHSRGFIYPAVGLAVFPETNFQDTKSLRVR